MKRAKGHKNRLDDANVQLSKELWLIKSGLAVYQVIGLNVESIESGGAFFGLVQKQSLDAVVLGLAKVFERDETYELCSVRGVYRLAKQVQIQDTDAARAFVGKYGISESGDWIRDVDQVFSKQRPRIQSHLQKINRVRNTRLAHIQQNAPSGVLPSITLFEDLLGFAFDFHSFVNEAFLSTPSHPILDERKTESSLLSLLKKIGVNNPASEFEDA
jgi:hypothetical protein